MLNVQSTSANDLQNVIVQENTLNIALLQLAQLLQISPEGFDVVSVAIDDPSAAFLYRSSKEVYNQALTNRPEISRAKLNVENADLTIDLAKGALLPTLSFFASANTSYQTVLGEEDVIPVTAKDLTKVQPGLPCQLKQKDIERVLDALFSRLLEGGI